jgi:uncharacterized integral membrane protein
MGKLLLKVILVLLCLAIYALMAKLGVSAFYCQWKEALVAGTILAFVYGFFLWVGRRFDSIVAG